MKITFISDTHCHHRKLTLTGGDVLVHCGDITNIGDKETLLDLNNWFSEVDYTNKVVIAGNHDKWLYKERKSGKDRKLFSNAHYLMNSSVIIDGLKFYGTPYCPKYGNFPFMFERNSEEMISNMKKIPDDTDVLITHTPAYGCLDSNGVINCGSEALQREMNRIDPMIHAFGHIHESYGAYCRQNHFKVNASIMDLSHRPTNKPIDLEV